MNEELETICELSGIPFDENAVQFAIKDYRDDKK